MKTYVDICCPGNGKRYELMYTKTPPHGSHDVFAWLNSPWGGRAMKISSDRPHIHWTHLQEELGRCGAEDDYAILLAWLQRKVGVTGTMPRGYDSSTGLKISLHLVE